MVCKSEHMNQVTEYIEEHLAQNLKLDQIADAMHYSKFHLHRIFSECAGLTLHDYIQRRRLTEAAKLLVYSEKRILDIAISAGYESQQAFGMAFKSMYKKAPLQFRREQSYYPLQLAYKMKHTATDDLTTKDLQSHIQKATFDDIDMWMEFVNIVINGFPKLKKDDYMISLMEHIKKEQALIYKHDHITIGAMLFDQKSKCIDFFGIHPQFRELEIAKALLNKVMQEQHMDELYITTFREHDKADAGQRRMLKVLGFTENECLMEYGYPTQKFILKKSRQQHE